MESYIWNVLSLKGLKGSRTQMTILVGAVLNLLVGFGILHLTAEDLQKLNEALMIICGYFFVDKVQGVTEVLKNGVKK
jgi:hypothetical protein